MATTGESAISGKPVCLNHPAGKGDGCLARLQRRLPKDIRYSPARQHQASGVTNQHNT